MAACRRNVLQTRCAWRRLHLPVRLLDADCELGHGGAYVQASCWGPKRHLSICGGALVMSNAICARHNHYQIGHGEQRRYKGRETMGDARSDEKGIRSGGRTCCGETAWDDFIAATPVLMLRSLCRAASGMCLASSLRALTRPRLCCVVVSGRRPRGRRVGSILVGRRRWLESGRTCWRCRGVCSCLWGIWGN